MLFTFLDETRKKSRAVRQRYAFLSAATFTLIVAGLWTLSLPTRFVALTAVSSSTVSEAAAASPFANMWNQIKSQVSDISFPSLKGATSTASSTSDATTTYDARLLLSTTTPATSTRPVAQEVLIEPTPTSTTSTTSTTTMATTSTATPSR
jgi:hypothetical protein